MSRNSTISTTVSRSNFRWYYILPVAFLTQVIGMADKINVGFVMAFKPFLQEMHLVGRPEISGLLASLFLIAYGVSQPIWGVLSDRVLGPRRTTIIALIIWCLMLVLGGLAPSLTVLFISRIGLGLGEGALWTIGNSLIGRWFPLSERSRAQAIWVNGINIGVGISGLVVSSVLVGLGGWRPVFFILALIGLIPLLLFVFIIRDNPRELKGISQEEVSYIEAGRLAKPLGEQAVQTSMFANYRFWLIAVAFIASCMEIWGLNTWGPSFLVQARGMSMMHVGIFTGVAWLLATLVLFPMGLWSDRLMLRAPFAAVSYLVFGLAIYGAGVIPNVTVDLVLIAIAAWAQMVETAAIFALMHSVAKSHQVGIAAGVMSGLGNIVAAYAPYIMGVFIGRSHGFVGAFAFIGVVSVVAAILVAILIPQEKSQAKSLVAPVPPVAS